MISQETFNGGAQATSTSIVLQTNSPRVLSCYNSSSINVTLPVIANFPVHVRLGGSPFFYIMSNSSGSVVVKDSGGTTLVTLSAGKCLKVSLTGSGVWKLRQTTLGTARTATHGSRAAVANPTPVRTYSTPYCFEGTPCDLAESLDNIPLDGEDGRDLVIAPMFEDVTTYASNSEPEPVRAADYVMPSVVVVAFEKDQFEPDPAHPLASTVLPQAFYDALYAESRPHGLAYFGSADGDSRNWHHIRYTGGSPVWGIHSGGTLAVKRHIWVKDITYTGDDGNEYVITLAFALEHTVDPVPTLEPGSGGGTNDRNYGLWGGLFRLCVFCNQLAHNFVDGGTFTPVGAIGAITFTRDDPLVWDAAQEDQKFCHPQLVAVAHIPTTFEAPLGSKYVPWEDRKFGRVFEGGDTLRLKNRELCYKVSNGAPWTPAGCTNAAPGGVGIDNNIVFGWRISTFNYAGITLGGAYPHSKPMEWMVIENGNGDGRTYLRPLKPGWSETCGELSVEDGSSITITLCSDDSDGVDDGSGHETWPGYKFNPCVGHPDEPFEGVGGTHTCFNNNGDSASTGCCVSIENAITSAVDVCARTTTTYGDYTGSSCHVVGSECNIAGSWLTQIILFVEDYTYNMNGSQDSRALSWLRLLPDPDQVFKDHVYAGTFTADYSQIYGTWTASGSYFEVASAGGSGLAKAFLQYLPSSYAYRDMVVTGTFKKAKQAEHGILIRSAYASSNISGYLFNIKHTSGNNGTVTIEKIVTDTVTVLATKSITNLDSDDVAFTVEGWGTGLSFSWTVSGHDPDTLVAEDCTFEDGGVGVVTKTASTNVRVADFEIDDNSTEFLEATASFGRNTSGVTFPFAMRTSYGRCEAPDPTTCGDCCDPPHCNCTEYSQIMVQQESATAGGAETDIVPRDCDLSVTGDNPTWCGGPLPTCVCDGPPCGGSDPPCEVCPPPFVSLSFCIPKRCRPVDAEGEEPKMCSGLNYWTYVLNVCA